MRILTVCGMGSGSSLILKINVDEVLKQLGLKATVENTDASSYKSVPADMIFCTVDLGSVLKDATVPVYLLKTVLDKEGIKAALLKHKATVGWK